MDYKKVKCFTQRNVEKGQTTLILDRKHYSNKPDPNAEIYNAASRFRKERDEETYEYLVGLVAPDLKMVETVEDFGEGFEVRGGEVYLKGTNVKLPKVMIDKLKHFIEEGYPIEALANFWSLCLLNPTDAARERFLGYCLKYNVTITDGGYAVMYKYVTHKKKAKYHTDLADFIAEAVMEVKKKRKAKKWYDIYFDKEEGIHILHHTQAKTKLATKTYKKVGNLDVLFGKLAEIAKSSETLYTDRYSGKSDIRLGHPEKKDRKSCDPDINQACGVGLHVGSYQYVKSYSNLGETILAILVNPANVVALPQHDDSKIRVCEYYPYAIMKQDEHGDWEEVDSEYFEEEFRDWEKTESVVIQLAEKAGEGSDNVSPRVIDLYSDDQD